MKTRNLILQWIRHCTPSQQSRVAERIDQQLAKARCRRDAAEDGPSSAEIMATVLFVECAGDLDLKPLELHGLIEDPRQQSLEAVATLAMDWIKGRLERPARDQVLRGRNIIAPRVES